MAIAGRDRETAAVIEALQEVYRDKLRPIEQLSFFDKVANATYFESYLTCLSPEKVHNKPKP